MNLAGIPTKISVVFAEGAGAAFINVIPIATTTPGRASWTAGFPPVTMQNTEAGGLNPLGQDFNGVGNALSAWIQWSNAGGPISYDAGFAATVGGYPKGAVLASTVGPYWWLNLTDGNTTNPDSGGSNWIQFAINIPIYAGNPNGNVAGVAGNGALSPSFVWDTVNRVLWTCVTSGNAAGAVWVAVGQNLGVIWAGTATGTANDVVLTPAVPLPAYGTEAIDWKASATNNGPMTATVSGLTPGRSIVKDTPLGPLPLQGGEVVSGNVIRMRDDGSVYHIQALVGRSFVKLASFTTVGGESHVDFTNISQAYSDLLIAGYFQNPSTDGLEVTASNNNGTSFSGRATLAGESLGLYWSLLIPGYTTPSTDTDFMIPALYASGGGAFGGPGLGGSSSGSVPGAIFSFMPFTSGGINALRFTNSSTFPAGDIFYLYARQ